MKATLRQKKIKNGKSSLYIDFYPPIIHPETGKSTRREFLVLHLFNRPKDEEEKSHNKKTKALARNICAKRQIDIQNENFDFLCKQTKNESFLNYFKEKVKKREATGKNYQSWKSTYSYLYRFTKGHLAFKQVTEPFCKDFKEYLLDTECLNSRKKLKHNSAVAYFNIFKEATNDASHENYFKHNPAKRVKSIPYEDTEKSFLILEELQVMAKTECSDPLLKKAALFSAMTGLRWSDIETLKWHEIHYSESNGYYIRFTTQKTNRPETLPISINVIELIGEKGRLDQDVFDGLTYGNNTTTIINQWAMTAGVIKNKLTFHSFRHTYATLQLTLGTDIYTVSKLLGHKRVETTQVYAKVIDKKKQEAANRIPKLGF